MMGFLNGNLAINILIGIGCRLLVERLKLSTSVSITPNTKINYSDPWYELKLDSEGNVVIKSEKESYTREEVKTLIIEVFRDIYPDRH